MRAGMRLVVCVAVLGLLGALGASGAAACTPLAHLLLDQRSYEPGDRVTVTGNQFKPDAATPVRVTLNGGVVGETSIQTDGSWTLSFSLSNELAAGMYVVSAEAREADGRLVEGLPAKITLPVVVPSEGGGQGAPATDRQPDEGGAVPQPVSTEVAPLPAEEVASSAQATRTNPVAYQAAPQLERLTLPQASRAGTAERLPVVAASIDEGAMPWASLALAGVGLLLLGGAGGAFVASRRGLPLSVDGATETRQPIETAPQTSAIAPSDRLEEELQELLNEERARRGRPREPTSR